jgi:ABC-type glycerol-3-phosphate transport system permease component
MTWRAALLAALVSLPLLFALYASVTPESSLFGNAGVSVHLVLDHYRALFADRHFQVPILNSLWVAGWTTLFAVALGSVSAYAIARLHFPGRRLLLVAVLGVSMFPQISIVPPLYLVLRATGLVNTYPGLVLPYLTFAMPLAVWLLTSFFRTLPIEVEQAALVDGASRLRVLWEITLPLSGPGLVTTCIITFIYCWNEFLFALAFTVSQDHYTVPVALALFRGQHRVPWGEIFAAAIVASVPVAALVLAFQRRIVQGLTAGAVKG